MKVRFNQIVLLLILFSASQLRPQITSHWNSDTSFYFYTSDSNAKDLIATKVIYDSKLTKEEILDSVASYLSNTYFIPKHKYYEGKQKIIITIMDITSIDLTNRKYSIATVGIDDPDKICMGTYFQGSAGGKITFLMLIANFMQPQLKYPLLDGLIILYNNTELKGMDHINLEGLISEREIDNTVRQALKY